MHTRFYIILSLTRVLWWVAQAYQPIYTLVNIFYEFSTTIPLIGLRPLLDSLVYRFKLDNPLVLHAKKALINSNK
jgi:hypothetical protein